MIECNIKLADFPKQVEFPDQAALDEVYTGLLKDLEAKRISPASIKAWKESNLARLESMQDEATKETVLLQNRVYDLLLSDCWHFKHNLCSYQDSSHCNKRTPKGDAIACPKEVKL